MIPNVLDKNFYWFPYYLPPSLYHKSGYFSFSSFWQKQLMMVVMSVMSIHLLFPQIVKAEVISEPIETSMTLKSEEVVLIPHIPNEPSVIINHLPLSSLRKPQHIFYTLVTAYSSTPEETDETPFITALGTETRDGVIASNFLPFGTKLRLPEKFGNKIFVVEDRMHPRFSDRIDIWMPSKEKAKEFGRQWLRVEIY